MHLVDDVPVAVAQTCMLPEAITIAREEVAAVQSYELLERLPGWRIADAEMTITAVAAAEDIATCLGVTPAAPLLMLRRTSRLADGRTWESTVFQIRPERFDLVVRSGLEARLTG